MTKYGIDMVVANLLQTATTNCKIYSKKGKAVKEVILQASPGVSLEEKIVSEISKYVFV